MEDKLRKVLKEYIKKVEEVCDNLLVGINSSENLSLKTKRDFLSYRTECKRMEFEINGIKYLLHGKGCMAYNKEIFLDWDFGYRSRWCGIEPWKVAMTLKKNNSNYIEYYDGNLIKKECEQMIKESIMFEQNGQYYFSIPEEETFIPTFPEQYDTLVIEYFDSKWSMPRNKVIDRFIRKSRRVYNQIYTTEDKYILRFFLEEQEISAIPYSDICYPETAVKIMSDDILRNLY